MIVSAPTDHRAATRYKPSPSPLHYIDNGAYAKYTLHRNVEDLSAIALYQRVPKSMFELNPETHLSDETLAMPVAFAPVDLTGMYARHGGV